MRRIKIAYETIWDGDEGREDRGWVEEEGYCVDPDQCDEPSTVVNCALGIIPACVVASDYPRCHPGRTWYTDADGDTDYCTGAVTYNSYHLVGFSEEEELAIYSRLISRN
jgi:hypothetical protein